MTQRHPDRIVEDRDRLLRQAVEDAVLGGAVPPGTAGYTDAQFQDFNRSVASHLKERQAETIDRQTGWLRDAWQQARQSGGASAAGPVALRLHEEKKRLSNELGYQDWGALEHPAAQKALGALDLGARIGGVLADRALQHQLNPYSAQLESRKIIDELRDTPRTSQYEDAGLDIQQLITNVHDELDRPDYYWGTLEAIADPIEFVPFGKGAQLAGRGIREGIDAAQSQARLFPSVQEALRAEGFQTPPAPQLAPGGGAAFDEGWTAADIERAEAAMRRSAGDPEIGTYETGEPTGGARLEPQLGGDDRVALEARRAQSVQDQVLASVQGGARTIDDVVARVAPEQSREARMAVGQLLSEGRLEGSVDNLTPTAAFRDELRSLPDDEGVIFNDGQPVGRVDDAEPEAQTDMFGEERMPPDEIDPNDPDFLGEEPEVGGAPTASSELAPAPERQLADTAPVEAESIALPRLPRKGRDATSQDAIDVNGAAASAEPGTMAPPGVGANSILDIRAEQIAIRPGLYQFRPVEPGSIADEALLAEKGAFDLAEYRPMVVWWNPKYATYDLLEGHHRYELWQRSGQQFETLPVQVQSEATTGLTWGQAIDFAAASNKKDAIEGIAGESAAVLHAIESALDAAPGTPLEQLFKNKGVVGQRGEVTAAHRYYIGKLSEVDPRIMDVLRRFEGLTDKQAGLTQAQFQKLVMNAGILSRAHVARNVNPELVHDWFSAWTKNGAAPMEKAPLEAQLNGLLGAMEADQSFFNLSTEEGMSRARQLAAEANTVIAEVQQRLTRAENDLKATRRSDKADVGMSLAERERRIRDATERIEQLRKELDSAYNAAKGRIRSARAAPSMLEAEEVREPSLVTQESTTPEITAAVERGAFNEVGEIAVKVNGPLDEAEIVDEVARLESPTVSVQELTANQRAAHEAFAALYSADDARLIGFEQFTDGTMEEMLQAAFARARQLQAGETPTATPQSLRAELVEAENVRAARLAERQADVAARRAEREAAEAAQRKAEAEGKVRPSSLTPMSQVAKVQLALPPGRLPPASGVERVGGAIPLSEPIPPLAPYRSRNDELLALLREEPNLAAGDLPDFSRRQPRRRREARQRAEGVQERPGAQRVANVLASQADLAETDSILSRLRAAGAAADADVADALGEVRANIARNAEFDANPLARVRRLIEEHEQKWKAANRKERWELLVERDADNIPADGEAVRRMSSEEPDVAFMGSDGGGGGGIPPSTGGEAGDGRYRMNPREGYHSIGGAYIPHSMTIGGALDAMRDRTVRRALAEWAGRNPVLAPAMRGIFGKTSILDASHAHAVKTAHSRLQDINRTNVAGAIIGQMDRFGPLEDNFGRVNPQTGLIEDSRSAFNGYSHQQLLEQVTFLDRQGNLPVHPDRLQGIDRHFTARQRDQLKVLWNIQEDLRRMADDSGIKIADRQGVGDTKRFVFLPIYGKVGQNLNDGVDIAVVLADIKDPTRQLSAQYDRTIPTAAEAVQAGYALLPLDQALMQRGQDIVDRISEARLGDYFRNNVEQFEGITQAAYHVGEQWRIRTAVGETHDVDALPRAFDSTGENDPLGSRRFRIASSTPEGIRPVEFRLAGPQANRVRQVLEADLRPATSSPWRHEFIPKGMELTNSTMFMAGTGFDAGLMMIQGPGALSTQTAAVFGRQGGARLRAAANIPLMVTNDMMYRWVQSVFNPRSARRAFSDLMRKLTENGQIQRHPELFSSIVPGASEFNRVSDSAFAWLPGVGTAIERSSYAFDFGRVLWASRMAESLDLQAMMRFGFTDRRQLDSLSPIQRQWMDAMGAANREAMGMMSSKRIGLGSGQRWFERNMVFFAAQYTRAKTHQFALAANLASWDTRAVQARMYLTAEMSAVMAGVVAWNMLNDNMNGQSPEQQMKRLSEVLNPLHRNFLSLRIGTADNAPQFRMGGKAKQLTGLLAGLVMRIPAASDAYTAATGEEYQTYGNIAGFITGRLEGQMPQLPSLALDYARGNHWDGENFTPLSAAKNYLSPFWLQGVVENMNSTSPYGTALSAVVAGAGEFTGVSSTPASMRNIRESILRRESGDEWERYTDLEPAGRAWIKDLGRQYTEERVEESAGNGEDWAVDQLTINQYRDERDNQILAVAQFLETVHPSQFTSDMQRDAVGVFFDAQSGAGAAASAIYRRRANAGDPDFAPDGDHAEALESYYDLIGEVAEASNDLNNPQRLARAEAALEMFRAGQDEETLAYVRRNTNVHDRMPVSVMRLLLSRESTNAYMTEILESADAQYEHVLQNYGYDAAQRWWAWFQMEGETYQAAQAA